MLEAAEHVMRIVDRMLDFRRLQSGDIEPRDDILSPLEVFEAVSRMTSHLQEDRDVRLTWEPAADEISLRADRALTVQMLHNLAENAIKYAPSGSKVSFGIEYPDGGGLALVVSDTGSGMNRSEIEVALQPYRRLERNGMEDPGGTGIGLPLVQQLMELHGGALTLHSAPGKGTRASLVFPSSRVLRGGIPASNGVR